MNRMILKALWMGALLHAFCFSFGKADAEGEIGAVEMSPDPRPRGSRPMSPGARPRTAAETKPMSLEERLNDPRLFARGESRAYRGERLEAISFPVGGIGGGLIQINGSGELAVWQIFNNCRHVRLSDSFFAVRAEGADGKPAARVLQTAAVGPFAPMKSLSFRGEYPFAWYDFEDPALPVAVRLEAYNPLVPLQTKDSAIPCAMFNLTAKNDSQTPVKVSFLASVKNPVGFTGAMGPEALPDDSVVLADFEGADYGDWEATGDAFGGRPAQGPRQMQRLKGFLGKGLVNTLTEERGDAATGVLISPPFPIAERFIHFLIGGGNYAGMTCVNLLIDDEVALSATGNNSDAMEWHSWDAKAYVGRQGRIQIVDKATGGWGHIDVDHIAMSDKPLAFDRLSGVGRNRNRLLRERGAAILHMTADRQKSDPGYGDMALAAFDGGAEGTAAWDSLASLEKKWAESGALKGPEQSGPSPANQTLNGALAVPFTLQPGQSRTVRFVLAWHFPNQEHGKQGWGGKGNMYVNWYANALDVARDLIERGEELTRLTRLYHDTLYASNLPYWLLDRISSQLAPLRSMTCFWTQNGYFGGYEGCRPEEGCCPGNCAHVWHYAQGHARLFPDLARRMREQALRAQAPDGRIPFRQLANFGRDAVDGQCGEVLAAYREHLMSPDSRWLDDHWPRVKKAMDYVIRRWDGDENGVLAGPQHNTLDTELGGSSSWLGSLYLAALKASERMAALQNDPDATQRYSHIRQSGQKRQNKQLWNGEYYIQIPGPQPLRDYNNGCCIDQALGQWWAHQLDLGWLYPRKRVGAALGSLFKYNFKADFHGIAQLPRKFVDDDDAGVQMVTWPHNDRPKKHILYADEVMSGFEYSAAAAMVQAGLLKEGFVVALAASDRYDGRLRTGLSASAWGYSGNPFGDDECGKFYARPMSVWSMLLACQGFICDGPAGVIGFAPVWKPEDHVSFFTAAEGCGLFTQKRSERAQTETIEMKYGQLRLVELVFELQARLMPAEAAVTVDAQPIPATLSTDGERIRVTLDQPAVLKPGSALRVDVKAK